jgi:hypothetical protein
MTVSRWAAVGGMALSGMLLVVAAPSAHAVLPPTADAVTIVKLPVNAGTQTIDPRRLPRGRSPLTPPEEPHCVSEFLSSASVGAEINLSDETHGTLTINRIKVTLELNITIWLPMNPKPRTVEHEEGHRQISEYFYRDAEAVARRIAEQYLGKVIVISGPDLRKAATVALKKAGAEITEEYSRQMPVKTTQARYDRITDHSRKAIPVADAIAQALKDTYPARRTTAPATGP